MVIEIHFPRKKTNIAMKNAEVADLDSARIPVPFAGSGSDLQLWSNSIYVLVHVRSINQFLETPYKIRPLTERKYDSSTLYK
jgi:hypothetical protein